MSFLTGLALRRRSVTILAILLVLAGGVVTYRNLSVELFPEVEFPLITISAIYPSANPEAVVRDVTEPIERALSGMGGLDRVQSISSENRSLVLVNFTFGTDMKDAERLIVGKLGSLPFPQGVEAPRVARISPDAFPVLQLSVVGEQDITALQQVVASRIMPVVLGVDGVFSAELLGDVQRQVTVTADQGALAARGLSLLHIANALSNSTVNLPGGVITEQGQALPVRTTAGYRTLDEMRRLTVGFTATSTLRAVILDEVADVGLGAGPASSISRTNGRSSIGISVLKDPDANTLDVTRGVLDALGEVQLPPGVEVVTLSNDGPTIEAQLNTLQREALLGFLLAVAVVFVFLLTLRPSVLKGLRLTARPTVVIGLSIPLSVFTGILFMGAQGMTLNLMTLGGLAMAVGRVVDDSIVVLENVYRHTQRGGDRWRVALDATREVAPAITASTLTTIVVFAPLAFIQGLVGSFFLPFALTVTYALIGSLLVALTAVPVLGALLLRPGDFPEQPEAGRAERTTWMQRVYTPVLRWALRNKAATLLTAAVLTMGSLALATIIPVTLFPSVGPRFLDISLQLPAGSSLERTLAEVEQVEGVLEQLRRDGTVEMYQSTIGTPRNPFATSSNVAGSNAASTFVRLAKDAPENMDEGLQQALSGPGRTIVVQDASGGPPQSGLEVSVSGSDHAAITAVAERLVAEFRAIGGIINITTDVTEARDEVVVNVKPEKAALLGLTARDVAIAVNQYLVGLPVAQMEVDGAPLPVVLHWGAGSLDQVDKLRAVPIAGPLATARLGDIAEVDVEQGPVSISRSDGERSATITGSITAEDTQAVGRKVDAAIAATPLPPGVVVESGGVFQQIAEGFQDIFLAMVVGVALVYLVMVASLGSLRNPLVIVVSLPLALIGALTALAITGRTLGLPALMGMLLLIGIVVTNAIVLIAFVEQLRGRGLPIYDALFEAGRIRLRPILMTAFTTIFALLPLAVIVNEEGGIIGAELATVVIGGLISATFLTLVVVPVMYSLFHRAGKPPDASVSRGEGGEAAPS
ncbi:MAG: efflux RND transporter permease subunit [Dehalococcoidia bacterium]|nr:efflux RND transporter permease subunit [Dehalococcoidia bacterium]